MKREAHARAAAGIAVVVAILLAGGCGGDRTAEKAKAASEKGDEEASKALERIDPMIWKDAVAVLETTQGTIKVRFFPDKAPEHVKNFILLAKSGYFDGTYFHRVYPGFMIQGGDPNTKDDDPANDGNGGHTYKGPGTFLKAEFNDVKHVPGILSMARMEAPDTAGSQFFIMVDTNPELDGKYTAFGEVVEGMDAVNKIVSQPGKSLSGGGVNPAERQLIKRITVVE
jgi:peptidyl-prolyl cis-trans isomerase B (cyclophilin B)